MIQTERIADGRRRFFTAPGVVQDVLLRARKGHQDRGLERGRDYEVETGGVTLRTVPKAGETVIILTGDRVREVGGPGATPADPIGDFLSSRPQEAFGTKAIVPAHGSAFPVAAADVYATTAAAEQRAVDPPTVFLDNIRPAPNVDPAIFDAPGIKPPTGPDLERLKLALLYGTRDTNDKNATRTAEWQDGLAKLTAVMLNAPDWDATRAAFLDITTYLHRG